MPVATPSEQRRPFQFRIWHLIFLTTVIAVYLGVGRLGIGVAGIVVFVGSELTVIVFGTAAVVVGGPQRLSNRLTRGILAGSCLAGLLFGWIPVLAAIGMSDPRPLPALIPIVACGGVLGSIIGLVGPIFRPIFAQRGTMPVPLRVSPRFTDRTQHPALKRATDRVMRALVEAKRFAIDHRHDLITPDHLLWALGHIDSGVARLLLERLGVDLGKLTDRLGAWIAAYPPDEGFGPPLLSAELERVLYSALKEAESMADTVFYLGTEHLLLGLLAHPELHATRLLQKQGVTMERFRAELARVMGRNH